MDKVELLFAPGFFVDRCGNVYDKFGNVRTKYLNGDGYEGVSIKTQDGVWVTFGVHRLVALAFLPRAREDRTEVNHRDSDKRNNGVENLEWVTPSENNIHSEVSKASTSYPTVKMVCGNEIQQWFLNLKHAASETGFSELEIWDSIKDGVELFGKRFEYQLCQGVKPVTSRKNYFRSLNLRELGTAAPARTVKILDMDTGDVEIFDSVGLAAKAFDTTTSHISQAIPKAGELRVFKGKYRVEDLNREFEFFPRDLIEDVRAGRKDVIAFNLKTKSYHLFDSAKSFVVKNNLSKKAVTTALKKKRLRVFGDWIPTYLSGNSREALQSFVEGLEST